MQLQIIRRICDNPTCGQKSDVNVSHMRPEDEANMSTWVCMSKEHFIGGQIQPLVKHACCASCAIEILRNNLLDLPKAPAQA